MSVRQSLFASFVSVFAGKFSLISLAAIGAVLSLSVYASAERTSFDAWAKIYYGGNYRTLAATKVAKLPPVDDALAFASLKHTADDDFSRQLNSNKFWRRRGGSNASKYIKSVKPSGLLGSADNLLFDPFAEPIPRARRPQSGLYRTMCVRSCDGYMWPVSFSTTKANLRVDENICRNSCAAPTRLYYYENPGQEPSDMVDRRGRSYNLLPTAWRFQQQRVASCKCRPDPWEPAAMARHAQYAKLKEQGKLKRFLRKASRKARRLSRRASIGGRVVLNSSVTVIRPTVRHKKRKANRKQRTHKRIAAGRVSGFSSKSYSGGRSIRSRAFRTDR